MGVNKCGECTVCCTLSEVKDINKNAWEDCKFCISKKGCSIYKDRPQDCKDFECAYLQTQAPIELRPDNCGVMFIKKSDRIFVGAVVPGNEITDVARGQIEAFKKQGFSVIMLKRFAKPHLEISEAHDREEIWKEYINVLTNGNV